VKRVLRIAVLPFAPGGRSGRSPVPRRREQGKRVAVRGKWCSGQKIVFFPAGPAAGVFAVNVYNGAKQAAADLGRNVRYVWSNWDPGDDGEPVQVGDRDQPGRHRRHGASG
jgi:hypothetical protein